VAMCTLTVRNERGGRPGRRAWLAGGLSAPLLPRWFGLVAASLLMPRRAHAVRVNDVRRFATLCGSAMGRRPEGVCEVPDGATVELVAEVSGLGLPPLHPRHWFVRVHSGPCAGAEFSVRQGRLLDERDAPGPPGLSGPAGPPAR
jgi:hypothetical protein